MATSLNTEDFIGGISIYDVVRVVEPTHPHAAEMFYAELFPEASAGIIVDQSGKLPKTESLPDLKSWVGESSEWSRSDDGRRVVPTVVPTESLLASACRRPRHLTR